MTFDNCIYPSNQTPNQYMENFHHTRKFLMPFSRQSPLSIGNPILVSITRVILPVLDLHITWNMQYVLFCVRLLSFQLFLRFLHSFFFIVKLFPLYDLATFFILSPVDEYLTHFQFLTIVNRGDISLYNFYCKCMF